MSPLPTMSLTGQREIRAAREVRIPGMEILEVRLLVLVLLGTGILEVNLMSLPEMEVLEARQLRLPRRRHRRRGLHPH